MSFYVCPKNLLFFIKLLCVLALKHQKEINCLDTPSSKNPSEKKHIKERHALFNCTFWLVLFVGTK